MTTQTVIGAVVTEQQRGRFLTLERQFCVFCWPTRGSVGTESYHQARVISAAERVGRTEAAYRLLARRRLTAHLLAVHPDRFVRA